jgi:hypothetical protein
MNIKKDIETTITGWFFIASALLLLVGWVLLPHKLGEYIIASDFAKVGESMWYWIWMFRIYIFGWVTLIIAAFALITISSRKPFRVLLFPGAGMLIVGTFTLAIAAAFYYNYGAWGVGQTSGKSAEEIQVFMNDILYKPVCHLFCTIWANFLRSGFSSIRSWTDQVETYQYTYSLAYTCSWIGSYVYYTLYTRLLRVLQASLFCESPLDICYGLLNIKMGT